MNERLLPHALGDPVMTARMRATPEDFVVEELAGFDASGSGEHLLLTIEKRGMNTAFAAKRIAQWAGVPDMGVGYAGLKDRHAVTRQRFSVHLPKKTAPDLTALDSEDMRVLAHAWHARKLPRGALAGNRFELLLRQVHGERETIEQRLHAIANRGVPNYFGEQRFGRDGDNVANALAMFSGRRVRREHRAIFLSAARSELFNRVLAARVAEGSWDRGLDGEVWVLDGSRSVFGPEPWNETLPARLAAFDIHPSGPLWGEGALRTTEAALAIETTALDDARSRALRAGLEAARLKQERRALRLRPEGMDWEWRDEDSGSGQGQALRLRFSLPAGCYATTVLAELGEITDASTRAL